MTRTTSPTQQTNGSMNLVLIVVVLAALMGLYLSSQSSRSITINRSATGFDALPLWLAENEIDAQTFYGRAVLDNETVSLRILPLFDVDLRQRKSETNDELEAMAETDRDIWRSTVRSKIERLPTLLVMPKWRAGVRSAAAIHPKLLISDESANTLMGQFTDELGTLVRDKEKIEFVGSTPSGQAFTLPYPQTLENAPCTPLIGTSSAVILGECEVDGTDVWVLADPDLLNNHGLSQGNNAEAVLNWLPLLAKEEGTIAVDVSTAIWSQRTGQASNQKRNWSDLARFFEYPFSVIWWSLAILGALIFWRAWRRYGAADARSEEESGHHASRLVSIDTKARLLRLSGGDDVLVRTYIDGRLERLADEILGAQRTRDSENREQLMSAIARRSPELANQLAGLSEATFASTASPDILLRDAGRLDDLIERTLDEFGRTRHSS